MIIIINAQDKTSQAEAIKQNVDLLNVLQAAAMLEVFNAYLDIFLQTEHTSRILYLNIVQHLL
uniref:Uncharacterized protein n=1 Tax=Arion vulgaris TaxID=1028688 RepID=A0A0B7B291_9EUPU